jgi:crotonobetaine/carnitine-CoA ligase
MQTTDVSIRPPWFHRGFPTRQDCVLRDILDTRATRHPGRRAALFEDGTEWTYGQCRRQVRCMAAALQQLGVRKGDRVNAFLPSGPLLVRTWFAVNYLGAVFVPLNTAYRGNILEHAINNARARLMVAHDGLLDRLNGLNLPQLERVIATRPVQVPGAGFRIDDAGVLEGDESRLDDGEPVEMWDPQTIIYTSGTTGPSKGVLSPYLQLYTTSVVNYGYLREGECILVNLPIFHVGGTSAITAALVRSGCFYLVDGFSTQQFWNQVRRGNCTATSGLIGVMGAFLARAKPRDDDADNPLSCMTMFPINAETVALSRRFGFDYVTGFNMTEVSTPLITDLNTTIYGSCGRPRTGITCRLVDEHDMEVPQGAVGELIVRSDLPWTMNSGYDNMPAETAKAWRNGWFHTGDAFRQDADGNYFFVDRIKDTIRRRGENISSMEVETEVRAFDGVAEAVAVGVAADGGEEEVLVAVVPRAGREIDPRALIDFLVPRLPYFMVPRYIRSVAGIPKTETNKQRKYLLREQGITADTWDREAAGIRLGRERLER